MATTTSLRIILHIIPYHHLHPTIKVITNINIRNNTIRTLNNTHTRLPTLHTRITNPTTLTNNRHIITNHNMNRPTTRQHPTTNITLTRTSQTPIQLTSAVHVKNKITKSLTLVASVHAFKNPPLLHAPTSNSRSTSDSLSKNEEDDNPDSSMRSYDCPYPGCGKTFTRRFNLRSHALVHSEQRPFACSHCHLGFARSDALRRHLEVEEKRDGEGGLHAGASSIVIPNRRQLNAIHAVTSSAAPSSTSPSPSTSSQTRHAPPTADHPYHPPIPTPTLCIHHPTDPPTNPLTIHQHTHLTMNPLLPSPERPTPPPPPQPPSLHLAHSPVAPRGGDALNALSAAATCWIKGGWWGRRSVEGSRLIDFWGS
ncbi:hypothetical protein BC829DRAFT_489158 [Chytridium lagenaria]|nr:hypothetical protein BC829DRAFT_489158 [Chytridium lagenaria]